MMTSRFTLYILLTMAVCLTAVTLRLSAQPALQVDLYTAQSPSAAVHENAVGDAARNAVPSSVQVSLHEISGRGLRLRIHTADVATARTVAAAVRTRLEADGITTRLAVESRARGGAAVYAATLAAAALISGLLVVLLAAAIRVTGSAMSEGGVRRVPAASAST
ncbi:hypothetical protein RDV64_02735 [Acuticoccus sp. MNP-M23]|uniref:hypothetical protein n=1 Tax=Acuticoccus sp. MNP-M23 TaxID=3072793 RepID=UPI0028161401|nr:hypothetical protein [Acuticoccus sp. MNP-M23]WMS43338.1 hypothetical protein RDV64_02735 [Acuticoccus sp. MNP-M23]